MLVPPWEMYRRMNIFEGVLATAEFYLTIVMASKSIISAVGIVVEARVTQWRDHIACGGIGKLV